MIVPPQLSACLLVVSLFAWPQLGNAKADESTKSNFLAELDSLQSICWPLIFSSPDTAEKKILHILDIAQGVPDSVRGVSYNHLAILRSIQADLHGSIEAFEKAADAFTATPKRRAIVLRNLALALSDDSQFDRAIGALATADSICLSRSDPHGVVMGHCARGNVYSMWGRLDESTQSLMRCLDGLDPADPKQAKSLIIEQHNLANVYASSGNYRYADLLYDQCVDEIKAMGRTYQWLQVVSNQINAKIQLGDHEQAQAILDVHMPEIEAFGAGDLLARGHALSSSLARKAGNATAAVEHGERAMAIKDQAPIQQEYIVLEYAKALHAVGRYAEGIAAIDQRLADISPRLMTTANVVKLKRERLKAVQAMAPADMQLQDAVEIIEQMDSIHQSQTSERLAVMTARYQLEDQQTKNKELEKRNAVLTDLADQIQSRNLTLGFSFALLLVIGGLAYRSTTLKNRVVEAGYREELVRRQGLEQERLLQDQVAEQQKWVAENQQKELLATTMELASFQAKLESAIEKSAAIGASAESLRPFIAVQKTNDAMRSFQLRFENIHKGFVPRLRKMFPELTDNDIEYCELLQLGLNTKEIAHVLNISANSATTRKYRVRKRMGLNDGERIEDHF